MLLAFDHRLHQPLAPPVSFARDVAAPPRRTRRGLVPASGRYPPQARRTLARASASSLRIEIIASYSGLHVRPFGRGRRPTMASADFCRRHPRHLSMPVAQRHSRQISPGIAHSPSRLCLSDLRRSVPCKYRALKILAFSPRLRRLYPLPVRQASALPTASFRFPVARDTLAVRLTLPLVGCVEDEKAGTPPSAGLSRRPSDLPIRLPPQRSPRSKPATTSEERRLALCELAYANL